MSFDRPSALYSVRARAVLCALVLWLFVPAGASASEAALSLAETLRFNVAPGTLASAILQFSSQAHVQIATSGPEVGRVSSPGAVGSMPIGEALTKMLAGTGFGYRISGDRSIAIVLLDPAAATTQSAANALEAGSPTAVARQRAGQGGQRSSPKPPSAGSAETSDRPGLWARLFGTFARGTNPHRYAPGEPRPLGEQPDAAATDELAEVTVTGSRVIANGNNSPTPVTVVTAAALQDVHPTTLIDGLNDLPVFSGSRSQQSNPVGNGVAGAGNAASNQLNLRNLGANRSLILFDNQRVPPTLINGVVDADLIPQMLIQRVDIVTGGASAVYGSDAVTGVVNFVPDKNFNGVRVALQYGVSGYGDDRSWKAGIAGGTGLFDGRAHVEASVEHYDDDGLLRRSDRPWNTQWAVEGAGTAASPYRLYDTVRLGAYPFGGLITSGVLAGQAFAANGVLSPFVHGAATASACCEVGGGGGYFDASMKAPLRMDQAFARFDYDFSDTARAHVQAAMNSKWNMQRVNYAQFTSLMFAADNAFLAPAYQKQLSNAGQAAFHLNELVNQVPPLSPDVRSTQFFVNAGVDGASGSYRWGLYFNYGQTRLENTFHNNINNERLSAALDAVVNPANGQVVCSSALSGQRPDCVPLNLFGPTAASPQALAYVFGDTDYRADTRSYDVNGSLSGEPFSTWAGPVTVAVSGEWRRLRYASGGSARPSDLANCVGLRFNCTPSTLLWQSTFAPRSPVAESVREVALEFDAPLIRDRPLARSVNLSGAARRTSYSTSGQYWSWKAGFDWHAVDQLRFRASLSRDIRAPTLNDLFAPVTIALITNTDLLTGTTPSIPSYNSGNPGLTAETGDTRTFGFVYQPRWLPRLSLSVDGYSITVDKAITQVQGFAPQIQQSCYASAGNSPYCALQRRPLGFADASAGNAPTAWYTSVINISQVRSYGTDFELNYAGRALGRRYALRLLAAYQPHIIYSQPATTTIDMGGVAFGPTPLVASPVWRLTGIESFDATDRLRLDLVERWRSALKLSGDPTQVVVRNRVSPVGYVDLNLVYRIAPAAGQSEVFLNIQNLLDKAPPAAAAPGSGTLPGQFGGWSVGDDPVGRYAILGVRIRR